MARRRETRDPDRAAARRQEMIDGDRLRKAFVAGMNARRMIPADVARALGISVSSLYNFLAGISHSLSWSRIIAVSRLLDIKLHLLMDMGDPDITALVHAALRAPAEPEVKDLLIRMSELVVEQRLQLEKTGEGDLIVLMQVDDAERSKRLRLLPKNREVLPGVASRLDLARRAFGVRVAGMAGAPLYPHGTILTCLPPDTGPAELEPGWRVVVRYQEDTWPKEWWKTVVRQVAQGKRSSSGMPLYLARLDGKPEPRGKRRISVPSRIDVMSWRSDDKEVRLVGTVSTAIIPEGPNL